MCDRTECKEIEAAEQETWERNSEAAGAFAEAIPSGVLVELRDSSARRE